MKYIRADISSGTRKPYYLKSKGIRPEGVYVRQGASSVPASEERIKAMIIETDGTVYEDLRSLEQKLTFITATQEFSIKALKSGAVQQKMLGIRDKDGLYTNLGLLLSDQCPRIIKAAVFPRKRPHDFSHHKRVQRFPVQADAGRYIILIVGSLSAAPLAVVSGVEQI